MFSIAALFVLVLGFAFVLNGLSIAIIYIIIFLNYTVY